MTLSQYPPPGDGQDFETLERAQRRWAARWDRIIVRLTEVAFLLMIVFVVVYFLWIWGLIEPAFFE